MRLNGKQMGDLCNAINGAYNLESLEMFLALRLERVLEDISLADRFDVRVFKLVQTAQNEGWILQLLQALQDDSKNPNLESVLLEILAASPIHQEVDNAAEVYEDCLVGRRAFVNRETLRQFLKKLAGQDARILAIRGPSSSGKSYSWYFINHLAKTLGHDRILVDMKDWTKPGGPLPDDVMESIVTNLRLDREGWPPDDLAQGARRGKKLADWLAGRSRDFSRPLWLVMDHLDFANLQDDTLELAEKLALAIHRDLCDNVLLVLVDFPRALHLDIEPFVLRDETRSLGESEVRLHFENLARLKGLTIDSDAIEILISEAFAGLSLPLDRDAMVKLEARVAQMSAGLIEVVP